MDAPTLPTQALTPPPLEERPVPCFFLIRQFTKDIRDSGIMTIYDCLLSRLTQTAQV